MLEAFTLGIASWGAALSTYLVIAKRRRRLIVGAEFGIARLGPIRNHSFFIVSVLNTGGRAVTIRKIEWLGSGFSYTLNVFGQSKGDDLPEKVEPDEELRILFDSDAAARAIAPSGNAVSILRIQASGIRRDWRIPVTKSMQDEAEDHQTFAHEAEAP